MTNPELVAFIADVLPDVLGMYDYQAMAEKVADALDGKIVMRSELEAAEVRITELEQTIVNVVLAAEKLGLV